MQLARVHELLDHRAVDRRADDGGRERAAVARFSRMAAMRRLVDAERAHLLDGGIAVRGRGGSIGLRLLHLAPRIASFLKSCASRSAMRCALRYVDCAFRNAAVAEAKSGDVTIASGVAAVHDAARVHEDRVIGTGHRREHLRRPVAVEGDRSRRLDRRRDTTVMLDRRRSRMRAACSGVSGTSLRTPARVGSHARPARYRAPCRWLGGVSASSRRRAPTAQHERAMRSRCVGRSSWLLSASDIEASGVAAARSRSARALLAAASASAYCVWHRAGCVARRARRAPTSRRARSSPRRRDMSRAPRGAARRG